MQTLVISSVPLVRGAQDLLLDGGGAWADLPQADQLHAAAARHRDARHQAPGRDWAHQAHRRMASQV